MTTSDLYVPPKIVVVGAGQFSRVFLELFGLSDRISYYHEFPRIKNEKIKGVPVAIKLLDPSLNYISPLFDTRHRRELVEPLVEQGAEFITLVHPRAFVTPSVKIGVGCIVTPDAYIEGGAEVGDYSFIHCHAIVGHGSKIGRYAMVSPGAFIGGNVVLADGVTVGANATILPGVKLGMGCIVGAGAVITKDVPPNQVWAGVPARMINRVDEW